MYSHDKTLSKCNLLYTLHLEPKCHKCSIVGPFMVHDNFKFRKLCCVTFLQIVKHKLYVFVGQKPFLPDDFTASKSVRTLWLDVLESLKYSSAWKTKPIYFMFQTAQNVVIQYALLICFMRLEFSAKKFWLKVKRDWILLEH